MGNTEHLTTRVVDLSIAGLLENEEAARVHTHLAACEACAAKVAEAQSAKDQFLAHNPPALRVEALLEKKRRPFWKLLLAPGLATLAATMLVLLVVLPKAGQGPDILMKSGGGIVTQVQRPSTGESWTGLDVTVREGDVLKFRVDPGELQHLSLFVLDEKGAAQHLQSTRLEGPGALPWDLVADDAKEPARLVFILSEHAEDPASLDAALEAAWPGSVEVPPTFTPPVRGEARVHSALIRKKP